MVWWAPLAMEAYKRWRARPASEAPQEAPPCAALLAEVRELRVVIERIARAVVREDS